MAEGDVKPVAAEGDSLPPADNGTSDADLTKLEGDIIRQVEYYFGDANLARDKFLQEQITKDDGWVPLTVLLTFKRLQALTTEPAVIVAAISKSDEGLIEVHESAEKIRRHPERPLPEQNVETRKEQFDRTVYLKGFPLTEDFTMEHLLAYFQPVTKVVNVIMRKYHDKPTKTYKFKGSVFITFATKEQAEAYMGTEKLPEYEGKELIRKWRNDYVEQKKEEFEAKKSNRKGAKKEAEPEVAFTLPTGALLKLEEVVKETTRESIKAKMAELGGEVSFVEFSTGDEMAVVRLKTENAAKELKEKLGADVMSLDGAEVKVSLIEGDEEQEFLAKAVENMKQRRSNQHKNKGGRGNKGFGKYHHHNNNRKREAAAGGGDEGEPPSKK